MNENQRAELFSIVTDLCRIIHELILYLEHSPDHDPSIIKLIDENRMKIDSIVQRFYDITYDISGVNE